MFIIGGIRLRMFILSHLPGVKVYDDAMRMVRFLRSDIVPSISNTLFLMAQPSSLFQVQSVSLSSTCFSKGKSFIFPLDEESTD